MSPFEQVLADGTEYTGEAPVEFSGLDDAPAASLEPAEEVSTGGSAGSRE